MKMRRADRLFEIIQQIRRGRLTTARKLAERLEVSERTIYRDICDLIACEVPIEGEAGVGYSLRQGYDLPPLMFTEDELEALIFGARIVSQQMVCKWQGRFIKKRLDGLLDEPRPWGTKASNAQ